MKLNQEHYQQMVINEKETSTLLIVLDYFIADVKEFYLSGTCHDDIKAVYLDVVGLEEKIQIERIQEEINKNDDY